jgi:heme-degrading monooxygenase HmoA
VQLITFFVPRKRSSYYVEKKAVSNLFYHNHLFFIITTLLFLVLIPLVSSAQKAPSANITTSPQQTIVARMWHGRTPAAKSSEYTKYLYETGIKKIRLVDGNKGVQVFRRTDDKVAEFYVISYWISREAIKKYAGEDIEKTHHLPRDKEFLLELEPKVKTFDLLVDEWNK